MSKPKVEFVDPRDVNPQFTVLQKPVFDAGAVARADDTLKAMSGSMEQWLEADVHKLQTARQDTERRGWDDAAQATLFTAAHDLKGMGGTYGYPLVTELAASLCRLIETDAGKQATRSQPTLATAHVDAIRAAVRDRITSSAHPLGRALLAMLEAKVDSLGVAAE